MLFSMKAIIQDKRMIDLSEYDVRCEIPSLGVSNPKKLYRAFVLEIPNYPPTYYLEFGSKTKFPVPHTDWAKLGMKLSEIADLLNDIKKQKTHGE